MNTKKTIQLGKVAYTANTTRNAVDLSLNLQLIASHRLRDWDTLELVPTTTRVSISGGIWNASHSDYSTCGQCIKEVARLVPTAKVKRIAELWKQYHLNDFKSGTAIQTAYLDGYLAAANADKLKGFQMDHYGMSCQVLKDAGLYEDRGYKYGTGWLVKQVPTEVIDELKELFGIAKQVAA